MTKIHFKDKKAKTVTTIMGAVLIGLLMFSPSAVLPYVNAQQVNRESNLPPVAQKLLDYMHQQFEKHPDWVGMMRWNTTAASFDYLGPANQNPYRVHGIFMQPTGVLNGGVGIVSDRSNGGTSEWKEISTYTNQALSSTNTDLFQVLNAMNSNSAHWLQVAAVYDNAQLIGTTGVGWKVTIDSFSTSACSTTGEWFVSSPIQTYMQSGHSMQSFLYADQSQAGHYDAGVTDTSANNGYLYGFGITGDSGSTINLGETDIGSCHFSSGPEQEEQSDGSTTNPTKYNNEAYAMGFYDTPTSSETTSVQNWETPWLSSCMGLSPNPPPTSPAVATFTYTC